VRAKVNSIAVRARDLGDRTPQLNREAAANLSSSRSWGEPIIAKGLTVREAATWLKVGRTALYAALRF
jgi:hypothetical protein